MDCGVQDMQRGRGGRQGGRRAVKKEMAVCLRAVLLPGNENCLVGKLLRMTRAATAGAAAFWHLYLCAVAIVNLVAFY